MHTWVVGGTVVWVCMGMCMGLCMGMGMGIEERGTVLKARSGTCSGLPLPRLPGQGGHSPAGRRRGGDGGFAGCGFVLSGLGLGSCLPRLPTEGQGAVIWLVRGKDQWWAEGGYEDVGPPGPPAHVGSTGLGLWLGAFGALGLWKGGACGKGQGTSVLLVWQQGSMLVAG